MPKKTHDRLKSIPAAKHHPLAEAIVRARLDAGLTQVELAEAMGTSQVQLSRWETSRVASVDDIAEIEAALELPAGTILADAGYVSEPDGTVIDAIARDTSLTARSRELLLATYQAVRRT